MADNTSDENKSGAKQRQLKPLYKNALIYGVGVIVLIIIITAITSSGGKKSTNISTASTAAHSNANQSGNSKKTTDSNTASNTPLKASQNNSQPKDNSAPAPTPKPAPAQPKVLLNMSGNGDQNSAPFLVSESQLTVTYSYDCSAFGSSGNFIADLLSGNQSDPNSDDQSIANALGNGASNVTTTIYPQNTGQNYYLSVSSECSWSVEVTS